MSGWWRTSTRRANDRFEAVVCWEAGVIAVFGTTLSHYRITEKLGAGSMGEVYRAEHANLDLRVAIKVLPDIFSNDPNRLARFKREPS